jgi:putative ATP-dependent endonuclease of OLD family
VYLRKLSICNFRKLKSVEITFEPGLNILVGPNNVGKTTVIDALRALLNNQDEPSPRLSEDDIYRPKGGTPAAPSSSITSSTVLRRIRSFWPT